MRTSRAAGLGVDRRYNIVKPPESDAESTLRNRPRINRYRSPPSFLGTRSSRHLSHPSFPCPSMSFRVRLRAMNVIKAFASLHWHTGVQGGLYLALSPYSPAKEAEVSRLSCISGGILPVKTKKTRLMVGTRLTVVMYIFSPSSKRSMLTWIWGFSCCKEKRERKEGGGEL